MTKTPKPQNPIKEKKMSCVNMCSFFFGSGRLSFLDLLLDLLRLLGPLRLHIVIVDLGDALQLLSMASILVVRGVKELVPRVHGHRLLHVIVPFLRRRLRLR